MAEGTNATPSADPMYPSLDVIRQEVDVEAAALDKRSASVDTRAGFVLGFAGVLVGLTNGTQSWWLVAGQGVAVVAGVLALISIEPRYGMSINVETLRKRYLTTTSEATRLHLLDTRISVQGEDKKIAKTKTNRLRLAIWTLLLAIFTVLIGSIVAVVEGGDNGQPADRRTTSSSTTQPS